MNNLIFLLIISALLMSGCAFFEKGKTMPPSVSTSQVIESLNETKNELKEAGEQNTKVAKNIDVALSLAEKLDLLLVAIEKEQEKLNNKNIIKPIK